MENFVLSCCSTADLSLEHFQNRNIHYICFHYELNGTVYPDDLGQSMPFDVFYEAMTRGAETKTFQVNVAEFEAYFESFLKEGKDILHLCLLRISQRIFLRKNIPNGKSILWIPWRHPPATGF